MQLKNIVNRNLNGSEQTEQNHIFDQEGYSHVTGRLLALF